MAAVAHFQILSIPIDLFVQTRTFIRIRGGVQSVHPDVEVARGFPPTRSPATDYQDCWLSFSAFVRSARFTKRALHLIRRSSSPLCVGCGLIKDAFHIYGRGSSMKLTKMILRTQFAVPVDLARMCIFCVFLPALPIIAFVRVCDLRRGCH